MKLWTIRIAVFLLAAFLAIQLVPVDRSNPPVTGALVAPRAVEIVLKRACYDCHSNETMWPWYAYVAPVSWLVADDVEKGRKRLNFSRWTELDANKRMSKADSMIEEIERGGMPMPNYVKLHSEAALSPADVETLRKWAENVE